MLPYNRIVTRMMIQCVAHLQNGNKILPKFLGLKPFSSVIGSSSVEYRAEKRPNRQWWKSEWPLLTKSLPYVEEDEENVVEEEVEAACVEIMSNALQPPAP